MDPPPQRRPRILLACVPSEAAALERLVPRDAHVILVSSIAEALDRMGEGVDAIVCSLEFDESRMLDLAREAHARIPDVPVLCCATGRTRATSTWLHAAAIAAASLGAAAFIDIPEGFSSDLATQLLRLIGRL